MKIKIGADPELFIRDRKSLEFVSAAGHLPGDKKNPFKVEKGAVQVDGVAFEFNIDPVETEKDFSKNINTVMAQMTEMVTKVNPDWELVPVAFAEFTKENWKKIDRKAKILGCDPDYNYRGEINPNPSASFAGQSFRTASGHIHIGWSEGESPEDPVHFEDCRFVADGFSRSPDFLYMHGVKRGRYFDLYHEPEEQRRLGYYGAGGAFRAKTYGVELRSPSNHWLRTPERISNVYNIVTREFHRITNT